MQGPRQCISNVTDPGTDRVCRPYVPSHRGCFYVHLVRSSGEEWSHLHRRDDFCLGGSLRNVTRTQEMQSAQWTCIQCYAAMHSASQTIASGAQSPAHRRCVIHPPRRAYRPDQRDIMYGTYRGTYCADSSCRLAGISKNRGPGFQGSTRA